MLLIAVFLVALIALAVVSRRFVDGPITPPAIMIAAGIATGLATGTSGPDRGTLILLAEVTLSVVLFSDASRISPGQLRHGAALPGRLLGIGLPLSMLLITVTAMLTLDMELGPALLLGASLSATDAALAGIIVKAESLPRRLRQAINVESGLNDGLASPIVTIAIALMIGEEAGTTSDMGSEILVLVISAVLIGAVVGTVGGWLLHWGRAHDLVDPAWAQLATLGIIGVVTTVAMAAGAVTFVAAFVAGLAFRVQMGEMVDEVCDYSEDTAEFLTVGAFFLFGLLVPASQLGPVRLGDVVFALFALTIARMLPVAIAMLGTGDAWQTVAMIGWFGPRGLATALFALIALEEAGAAVPDRAVWVLVLTVLASVLAHGASAAPLTRRYAAWAQQRAAADELPMDPMHHPDAAQMPVGRTRR